MVCWRALRLCRRRRRCDGQARARRRTGRTRHDQHSAKSGLTEDATTQEGERTASHPPPTNLRLVAVQVVPRGRLPLVECPSRSRLGFDPVAESPSRQLSGPETNTDARVEETCSGEARADLLSRLPLCARLRPGGRHPGARGVRVGGRTCADCRRRLLLLSAADSPLASDDCTRLSVLHVACHLPTATSPPRHVLSRC